MYQTFVIEEADAYERQTIEKRETYERQTNDELTANRRSGRRVSTGEAKRSIGLSIRVVSVLNRIKNPVTSCFINQTLKTHSFNI